MPPGRPASAPPYSNNNNNNRGAQLPLHPSPSNHNKLTLTIFSTKSIYISGEKVSGLLELDVLSKNLSLGDLGIEFTGLEELRSLDHTATRILLTSRLDFQGGSLQPSAAIVPNSRPISGSFYPALKGRTRFPFSFTLPSSSPSSCSLGSNATTRYELRAFASSLLGTEVDIKSERKEIKVVERWGDWEHGNWTEGCSRRGGEKLKLGGEGKLEVMAEVGKEVGSGRLFWRTEREAGMEGNGSIKVKVRVRNGTKKNVSGLKLSICRRLRILDPKASGMSVRAPIITSTVVMDHFRGIGFEFPVGEDREVTISTEVPLDECWTVRKGTLFELDVLLRVEVECGFLAKDLAVELPIWIAHPRSLPPAAHAHRQRFHTQILPPLPSITQPPFPGSRSSMLPIESSYSYPYSQPPPSHPIPLQDPYGDYGRNSPATNGYPSTSAPAPIPNQYQQHPHHPQYSNQGPYPPVQYGARPHYPPPTPPVGRGTPSPIPAPYYIAFDPYSPELTQSRFLESLNSTQPQQSFISPDLTYSNHSPAQYQTSTQSPPLPQLPPIIRPHTSQSLQNVRQFTSSPVSIPTTLSPPPAVYSPEPTDRTASPIERPLSSRSFRPADSLVGMMEGPNQINEIELERVRANVAPLEPYSATLRASMSREDLRASLMVAGRSNTAPLPTIPSPQPQIQSIPQQQQQVQHRQDLVMQKSYSMNSIRPARTPPPPPPPAPSSRFHTPSRSPSPAHRTIPSNFIDPELIDEFGLLDTIGEDGESQAGTLKNGTTKSISDLAAMLKRDESYHSISVQADGNSPGRNSVSDLEDLVDEEDRRIEAEKSLPRPPVPSDKQSHGKNSNGILRAQDIFSSEPTTIPSLTSTTSATSLLPPPSPTPIRSDRGLKALEARLSRPSTPEISTLPTTITTIRPLSPESSTSSSPAFKSGALRARSLSRVTSERNLAKMLQNVEPKEEVRKALDAKRREDAITNSTSSTRIGEILKPTAVRSTVISSSSTLDESNPSTRISTSIPTSISTSSNSVPSSSNSSTSIPIVPYVDGGKVIDIVEVKDLKKEAVARVSDWMKVDTPSSTSISSSPKVSSSKPLKRSTFDFVRHAPLPPPRSPSPVVLSRSPTRSSPLIEKKIIPTVKIEKEPTMEELLKMESRAGRLANPSSNNSKVSRGFAKKLGNGDENSGNGNENYKELGVNSANEFGARYDVRSARGGRGGVVSSVANKWAEMIVGEEKTKESSTPSSPVVPKALKVNSSVQNTPPSNKSSSQPSSPIKTSLSVSNSNPITRISSRPSPITNRRTPNLPHSASTPVILLQKFNGPSTVAKPFVNTTMGKAPILANNVPLERVDSPVAEGERKGKGGMSDLIARYSGQS